MTHAGIAQLIERLLAKQEAVSLNLISRTFMKVFEIVKDAFGNQLGLVEINLAYEDNIVKVITGQIEIYIRE